MYTTPKIALLGQLLATLLKIAGLKTTHLGLFGNPALGKYWTEHMLDYFDPADWVKCFI